MAEALAPDSSGVGPIDVGPPAAQSYGYEISECLEPDFSKADPAVAAAQ